MEGSNSKREINVRVESHNLLLPSFVRFGSSLLPLFAWEVFPLGSLPPRLSPFHPFLSIFRFLSAGSFCGEGRGIGIGGLGIIGTLGVVVPAWDSTKTASRASFFLAPLLQAPWIPLGFH